MNNKINFIIPLKDKSKENNKKLNFITPLKEKPKENNIYFLFKLPQSKPSVLEDDLEEEKEAKRILEDKLKKELNHFPNLNPI